MKPEHIAQELRLHNAWRRGEGVFDGETPAPMPQTPKELGEIIEAAAVSCDRVQLLAKALRIAQNDIEAWLEYVNEAYIKGNFDMSKWALSEVNKALAEAGLQEKVG